MAEQYVIVAGSFSGGERKDTIQERLREKGYVITDSLSRATLMVAGQRAGKKLAQARRRKIKIIDQTQLDSLAPVGDDPIHEPAVSSAPLSPAALAEEIQRLAALPGDETRWGRLCRALDLLPAELVPELVDSVAADIDRWPAHIRYSHKDHLGGLLEGNVHPRLRLVGNLVLSPIIKEHSRAAAQRILDMRGEHLPGVQQLRINHLSGRSDWHALLTPDNLAGVAELDLMYNNMGTAGLKALLSAADCSQITVLDLRANELTAADAKLLAGAGLTRLRWLHLYQNELKSAGLKHLCKAESLANLQRLVVSYNHLSHAAARHVAQATFARGLAGLKVKYNELGARGAALLAGAEALSNLRHLDISANEIGDDGLAALARSPHLDALERLDVEGNSVEPLITDAGARALAESDGLPALRALILQGNRVHSDGLSALLGSPRRRALKTLDLVNNRVEIGNVEFLMSAELPVELEELSISFDGEKPKKAFCRHLAGAGAFASLKRLVIRPPWSMEKDPEVTAALLSNPHLAGLEHLEMRDFRFDSATIKQLARTRFVALRSLNFSSPGFTDTHYRTLARAPWARGIDEWVISDYPKLHNTAPLNALFKGTLTSFVAF